MIDDASVNGQAMSFLLFVVSGILCGSLYELIRMLRGEYSKNHATDILFDILSSVCLFSFLLLCFIRINNLDIKLHSFAGLFLGIILYFSAFGAINRKILKLFLKIFKKIFKILLYPVIILCIIVRKIIYYIGFLLSYPYNILKNTSLKMLSAFKKLFKRLRKI